MKKLLDSKFLFILALSVVVLIVLGVGAFYLFDDSDAVFVKDGYILNPLSAKNEKYLFNKDTAYKENLSSMVVFNDTNDKEVSVFKDSFLHYMDSSMSFLKNGAILDLNSISDTEAVKFYNITSKSIIARRGDGYVIETANSDIRLDNFMGRISDNKYIIAGNLKAKIPGNEKDITANYFEIVYNDEGVVTLENSEVKYQVTAEGTYVYAGDVVIDLGNKKIAKGDNDVMSITAITINGDENIEIIPRAEDKEEDDNGGASGASGSSGNDGTGNQNDGSGQGGAGNADVQEDIKYEELTVTLTESEIHSTRISVSTKVINKREDDILTLRVTDLDSGKAIDKTYEINDDKPINVTGLAADTKYLFTVVNERDGSKYAQKMLKTSEFGVKLEQTYIMANEIGYKVTISDESEIDDVDVTLLKFNEATGQYDDPVETYHLSSLTNKIKGEHILPAFTDLDSNTIYTVTLDGFVIDSIKREKIYNITNTALTLKETPSVEIGREVTDDKFKLFVENVHDKDSAIVSYTYYVFDNNEGVDTSEFVFNPANKMFSIERTTAEPVEIQVGKDGILANHDYFYMVSVLYYDNEKYVEKVNEGRIDYQITDEPFVTIQKDDEYISYDTISAFITITDNSCVLATSERTCFDDYENYPIVVDVRESDGYGSLIKVDGYPMNISDFAVTGNVMRKRLTVSGLKQGTPYIISVKARRKGEDDVKEIKHGAVYQNEISTLWLPTIKTVWTDKESNTENPINGEVKLKVDTTELTISEAAAIGIVDKVIFRLYDGPYSKIVQQTLLASSSEYTASSFDIPNELFDNNFGITEELFGIDGVDALRTITKEKTGREDNFLSAYYTVEAEVYYKNGMRATVEVPHSFKIATYLTNDVGTPEITAEKIRKMQGDNFSSALTSGENGTVVGYGININIDKSKYETAGMTITGANIRVFDSTNAQVTFYKDDHETATDILNVPAADLGNIERTPKIYLANGIENGSNSTHMVRGKKYYAVVEITYDTPDGAHEKQTSARILLFDKKESPKINRLYIAETTKTGDITYKYIITDIDNAWRSENGSYNLHYQIGNGSIQSVAIVKNAQTESTFTISGLANKAIYTLSYNRDNYDTGDSENDTEKVTIGTKERLYDGYYNANDTQYNFKYRVISDPLHDNKVVVEILASDDIIDKILIYDVKFTDEKGNVYPVPDKVWNLSKCAWAEANDKNRCFEVPYTELTKINERIGMNSSMKSDGDDKNYITVSIESLYDNGLTGYDYIDRVGENKEFPYMIMQNDNTSEKMGDYVVVNNSTLQSVSATGNRLFPLAYHYFEFKNGGISYKSRYRIGDNFQIAGYDLDEQGYHLDGYGTLNPKMISVKNMTGVDNVFYFSSITPMINIDKTISLINGAKIMMTLEGADDSDFCAHDDESTCNVNGDKYLYVQVLDDDTIDTQNVGNTISEPLVKTIKVPLNGGNNINGQYVYDIINLLHDSKYSFKVYAYLNDGGAKKLTQIFDKTLKNRPDTYSFRSKKLYDNEVTSNGLLSSTSAIYQPIADSENYNAKELLTTINLNSYDTEINIPYIFNVSYEFCKTADCDEAGSRLFSSDIENTTKVMTSKRDITAFDLEYGKSYYLYLYMTYNYYDKALDMVVPKTVPVYDDSSYARVDSIGSLAKPTFTIIRSADYKPAEGGFVVDISVGITDIDHVLTDGKYYIKLIKGTVDDGNIVGDLLLKGNDGIYRQSGATGSYDNIPFDATVTNQQIRIGGLEANTSYTILVFGDVHMKNNDYDDYDFVVSSGKNGKGDIVWTTNDYGIAFGAVSYRAIQKGFIVSYGAGSNVDELHIQAIEIDIKENGRDYDNKVVTLGGENNKYLEVDRKNGKYRFVYEYSGDKENSLPPTYYTVATRYKIIDPITSEEKWIGKTWGEYYKALEQNVTYDPNEIINED